MPQAGAAEYLRNAVDCGLLSEYGFSFGPRLQ